MNKAQILFFFCFIASVAAFTSFSRPLSAVTRTTTSSVPVLRAIEGEISFKELDGSEVRVGIIKTRWNSEIIDSLVAGAKEALAECNVPKDYIFETEVPGAFELPLAARYLAMSKTVDAIICVGTLIKGDTYHFEYISGAVSQGLMDVGLSTGVPTVFGVLTTENKQQAIDRSTGANNHGQSWAKTAVEMGLLRMAALGQTGKKDARPKISFNPTAETGGEGAAPGEEKQKVFF
ncbi:unnamed protein product [Heterosigma akashiwo]